MSAISTSDTVGETVEPETRSRRCLRCNANFQSEWAGERICRRCKNTTAWRNGTPAQYRPNTRQR